jgi:hypothetical protein
MCSRAGRIACGAVAAVLVVLGVVALTVLIPRDLLSPEPLKRHEDAVELHAILLRIQSAGMGVFGGLLLALVAGRRTERRPWSGAAVVGWIVVGGMELAVFLPWLAGPGGVAEGAPIGWLVYRGGVLLLMISLPLVWGAALARRSDPETAVDAARVGGRVLVAACIAGISGQMLFYFLQLPASRAPAGGTAFSWNQGLTALLWLLHGWIGLQSQKVSADPEVLRKSADRIHHLALLRIGLSGGYLLIALLPAGRGNVYSAFGSLVWHWAAVTCMTAALSLALAATFRRPGGPDGDLLAVR